MKKTIFAAVFVVLLLSVSALVWAMDAPTITTPSAGDALGPNYDIKGTMPYRAFLVVLTDVIRVDTGEVLRSVPGIRHWTNQDGSFGFRCASPRVSIGERDLPLKYRVRCFESKPGENGPETTVMCGMAN